MRRPPVSRSLPRLSPALCFTSLSLRSSAPSSSSPASHTDGQPHIRIQHTLRTDGQCLSCVYPFLVFASLLALHHGIHVPSSWPLTLVHLHAKACIDLIPAMPCALHTFPLPHLCISALPRRSIILLSSPRYAYVRACSSLGSFHRPFPDKTSSSDRITTKTQQCAHFCSGTVHFDPLFLFAMGLLPFTLSLWPDGRRDRAHLLLYPLSTILSCSDQ